MKQPWQQPLERLGWPGVVAIALLFFSLSFYVSALLPLQQQLDDLTQRASQDSGTRPAMQPTPASRPQADQQLQQFYHSFPAQTALADQLDQLYRAASAHGIQLEKGDYQASREQQTGLIRYQITLPVSGSYPKLRQFIRALLRDMPGMAIDSIRLEREAIGENQISAELRLTLYFAGAPR